MGSRATETGGYGRTAAGAAFDAASENVAWCGDQFGELGYGADAARARAVHLVSVLQGAASLAKALRSAEPLIQEADHLERWIRRAGE